MSYPLTPSRTPPYGGVHGQSSAARMASTPEPGLSARSMQGTSPEHLRLCQAVKSPGAAVGWPAISRSRRSRPCTLCAIQSKMPGLSARMQLDRNPQTWLSRMIICEMASMDGDAVSILSNTRRSLIFFIFFFLFVFPSPLLPGLKVVPSPLCG